MNAELIRRLNLIHTDDVEKYGVADAEGFMHNDSDIDRECRAAAAALSTPRVQPIRYSPLAVYDDDRDEWHAEMFTDATGAWVKYADAAPQIPPTDEASEWDVRKYWKGLQESGLDGMSHEDGWTLMATTTAEKLKANQIPPTPDREKEMPEHSMNSSGAPTTQAKDAAVPEYDDVLHLMEAQGGSFVRSLAACYCCADPSNRSRLRAAFADYFTTYEIRFQAHVAARSAQRDQRAGEVAPKTPTK